MKWVFFALLFILPEMLVYAITIGGGKDTGSITFYGTAADKIIDRLLCESKLIAGECCKSTEKDSKQILLLEDVCNTVIKGEKGESGPTGPTGNTGPQGIMGEKGDSGNDGLPGLKGQRGQKGEIGNRGRNGFPGIKGQRGQKGDTGDRGQKGDIGNRGLNGFSGYPGIKGQRGQKGDTGDSGQNGEKGIHGRAGIPGMKGDKGEKGEKGRFEKCKDGWIEFGKSCYFIELEAKKSFTGAQKDCESRHASLAKIDNRVENGFLKSYLQGNAYFGLHDRVKEGEFVWLVDNSIVTFSDWSPGEPNDSNGKEDCALYWHDLNYQWNDAPCSLRQGYICEIAY